MTDRLNPQYEGFPMALGYQTKGGVQLSKFVEVGSTTEVNVFGATNGFGGSVIAVRVIPKDATQAKYTVYSGYSDHRTAIATVIKNMDPVTGVVTGSVVTVSGSFIAAGTLTAVASGTAAALVEVVFYPVLT